MFEGGQEAEVGKAKAKTCEDDYPYGERASVDREWFISRPGLIDRLVGSGNDEWSRVHRQESWKSG